MMRTLALIVLLFAASSSATSQLRFGVNGGINFSTAMIDPDPTAGGATKSGRTDLIAGLTADYEFCDRTSVRTEFNYIQYGYRFESSQTLGTQSYSQKEDYKVNYLEIPILGRYDFNEGDLEFGVFFGPFFGFRFCSQEEFSRTIGTFSQSGTADRRENTTKFHFGLTGGLGGELRLNDTWSTYLDARYNFGLSNIYKDAPNFSPPPNYKEPNIKYRSLNLHVGLLYNIP